MEIYLDSEPDKLCTKVKSYLYNYSWCVELSMNIHEGKD